jgi:phosphoribosyl 1,2-cyclic phosphodiesterase
MISGLRVLGSGTSSSTPTIRCAVAAAGPCPRCADANANPFTSKNRRNNPSLLVWGKDSSLLLDVGKTFRDSALRCPWNKYPPVRGIALTHYHADACLGLDDMREFSLEPLPLYCDRDATAGHVRRLFPHLVKPADYVRYVGQLDIREFAMGAPGSAPLLDVDLAGIRATVCPLFHGPDCTAAGFIFECASPSSNDAAAVAAGSATAPRRLAYFSDIGRLSPELDAPVIECARGVDYLFLDCMAISVRPGVVIPGHFLLPQAIDAIALIQPKRVFLTGIGHGVDHAELHDALNTALQQKPEPKAQIVEATCAYDGMEMLF